MSKEYDVDKFIRSVEALEITPRLGPKGGGKSKRRKRAIGVPPGRENTRRRPLSKRRRKIRDDKLFQDIEALGRLGI